jgi:thiol-disulfide isomerase/thioredoxin
MRSLFLAWAILLSVPTLCAQSPPPIKPLSIDDSVPDLIFSQLINYKETSAKLSDFKGKLLLLDFWTTSCSVCIKQFGIMNELQSKYGDRLQIMMINPSLSGNKKEKIEAVLQRWEKKFSAKFILPNSIEDAVFFNYFPFQVIPHYVWIDPGGFVKAITSHEEVNEENIQSAFAGNFSQLKLKKDILGFDNDAPLFSIIKQLRMQK